MEDRPNREGLTDTFKSVAETEIQNKEVAALMGQVDEDHPDILPGGLLSRLGLTDSKLFYSKEKKRNQDFRDWLWKEAVRRALDQINDIIKELQQRIEELLERMAKAEEALAELDKQHEILQKELEYFQEKGAFNFDEDGRLKTPEAEAIVTAWELKTGQTINRTDPASYEILLQMLVEMEQRQKDLREGMKKDAAEYEIRQRQLDEALLIQKDLQSGDLANNRKGIAAFEGFIRCYETEFDTGDDVEVEIVPVTDIYVMDALPEAPEELADEFSFGFAPLTKSKTADAGLPGQAQSGHGKVEESRRLPPPQGLKK
ncbi:MAG: hypothetical protein H6577_10085 [Lewinellaceae bacterium]|nr:hypothetical protein [Saprospiraceae bacterium]MCB9338466.1 hypothetical protein [Lewinellaceae bacterium]